MRRSCRRSPRCTTRGKHAYDRELSVVVDRERARYASWYECSRARRDRTGRHGTFADAERRLPAIAALGFDVVYLQPIHPIGARSARVRTTIPRRAERGR